MGENVFRTADDSFFCRDGREISSLSQLALALDEMHDDTFRHHVTDDRNDFAAWISHSLSNPQLAERVSDIQDRRQAGLELMKFLLRNI